MATRDEKNVFSAMIISRADMLKTDYIDAMVSYCTEIEMDIEDAATLINDVLKAKIEEEAQLLRIIPRSSKLPI